jgi:hypothetical protein
VRIRSSSGTRGKTARWSHAETSPSDPARCVELYSLACHLIRDRTEAEDVVQEVFAQAWRQAAGYEPRRASLAAWLMMITRSRAIDRLRARRTRLPTVSLGPDATRPAAPRGDPEASAMTAEGAFPRSGRADSPCRRSAHGDQARVL